MLVWAIVPVKPLDKGKSRLSSVLSEEERKKLNIFMLEHTIRALREVNSVNEILVISRDVHAINLARKLSVRVIFEDGHLGLNPAIRKAVAIAQAHQASGILILPADLPLINKELIEELLGKGEVGCELRIAPDNRLQGTNAVYLKPPGTIEFKFGYNSFRKHKKQAEQKGISVHTIINRRIGLDLDLPEDLILLQKMHAIPFPI